MTLRALDDIKESVRAAAATLVRTLRGLTLRVADPQLSPPAHAKAAISVALPLLLEKGATGRASYMQHHRYSRFLQIRAALHKVQANFYIRSFLTDEAIIPVTSTSF